MDFKLNMCRVCLKDAVNIFPLFMTTSSDQEHINFAIMLMSCSAVQVDSSDELPQYICEDCISLLNSAYNFKQKCEKSDLLLRQHISFVNEKGNSDEEETETINEQDNLWNYHLENNNSEVETKKCKRKIRAGIFDTNKEYSNEKQISRKCSDVQFNTNKELNDHSKVNTKIYKCTICDRCYTSSHGLNYHLKQHSGIKSYICPIKNCTKGFFWKQTLQRHMMMHSSEKNYLCYLCGKSYFAYDSLRYHLKDHKGERPHLCVHCGKTFKQVCHLKSHMWLHTGIKPHICKICNKGYLRSQTLKKHLKKYCGTGKATPQNLPILSADVKKEVEIEDDHLL